MAESVLKRLKKGVLVMTPAMGTMMAKMGADLSGYIGQWSVEHPEVSRDLLRDYFRVGCDIVFGGTFNLKERILPNFT
jgi:methionine synthase I (cobalamin-dependent)